MLSVSEGVQILYCSFICSLYIWLAHLRLAFILVFVEVQSLGPQNKPTQLPVFHDAPLPLEPAHLQWFLLILRRAGPGEPRQLSKHHALGSCYMETK